MTDQQMLEWCGGRLRRFEKIEEPRHFVGQSFVGGKEAKVTINFSGFFMKIARAEIGIMFWNAPLGTLDEGQF